MSTADPRRPVVVGAGGLGVAVAQALRRRGLEPVLVSRTSRRPVPAGLPVVRCDVADPRSDSTVFTDAGVIYNCAAPAYHRWPAEFPALQAGLLAAARRVGAVLVDSQNTYLYGRTGGPFSEDQPVRPVSRKGAVRARLAAQLQAAHERGDVVVTAGRLVSLYGPYQVEGRLGDRVFVAALAGGRAKVLGNLDVAHSASYLTDAAEALVTLGLDTRAWGRSWHLPAAPALTTRQFLHRVYAASGRAPRILNPPAAAVRLAALVNGTARELAEMLYMVEEPTVVDDSRFRATFGGQVTDHDEAIAETLDWFRHALPVAV